MVVFGLGATGVYADPVWECAGPRGAHIYQDKPCAGDAAYSVATPVTRDHPAGKTAEEFDTLLVRNGPAQLPQASGLAQTGRGATAVPAVIPAVIPAAATAKPALAAQAPSFSPVASNDPSARVPARAGLPFMTVVGCMALSIITGLVLRLRSGNSGYPRWRPRVLPTPGFKRARCYRRMKSRCTTCWPPMRRTAGRF